MIRIYLVFTFFFLFLSAGFSQEDYLLLKNGDMFWIKTLSKKGGTISYTIPFDHDNAVYFTKKSDIKKLISAKKIARKEDRKKRRHPDSSMADYNKKFLGIDLVQFYNSTLHINYMQVFKEGKFAFSSFASANFRPALYYAGWRRVSPEGASYNKWFGAYRRFSAGLELTAFLNFKRRATFHWGPAINAGIFDYTYADDACIFALDGFSYETDQPPGHCLIQKRDGLILSASLNTGFLFKLSKNIYIDATLGFGVEKWMMSGPINELKSKVVPGLTAGINF
jgi:hypothetical protein